MGGDVWELYIPSDLAYGDSGSPPKIKGGDTLIFKIEIIKINGDKVPALKCDPATLDGCNEKEEKYIRKQQKKELSVEALGKELKRLQGMKQKKMKPSLLNWVERRINIVGKMKSAKEGAQ